MEEHLSAVAFSKSWGLFYLIAMAIGATAYALWPANRSRFERAKASILDKDDQPWN